MELFLLRRKRDGSTDLRASAACCPYDLLSRSIDEFVIERLEANSNTLILHKQSPKKPASAKRSRKKESEV